MTRLLSPSPIVDTDSSRRPPVGSQRPQVHGKFIYVGAEKFYIRGVTYGPFRPTESGSEYHTPEVVERDFAQMAANGINSVRTYTVPPRWLLDLAAKHGLRLMIGLPWEQHVTFLDNREHTQAIVQKLRKGVRTCAGHPAVLCYVIGNEIPAPIVRWYGRRRVERFLHRLYRAAKAEDPSALVTYVNYPTTEYLQLPFVDFACFNVYLETPERLQLYLARLQNLVGEMPLVMAEIGLDSRRNGENVQAETLGWQVRSVFGAGCAGAFLFAWTDEWHRGGLDVDDWDFGLTDRQRRPKAALASVREAYADVPFPAAFPWPRISVVVCSHNGSRTIGECCAALEQLDYPDYEVIIVDDGSTDATLDIVREYGFRIVSRAHSGLSSARNAGLAAATGEIVAYTDDDTIPDPHWLTYLAAAFIRSDHAGIGGPNLPPPDAGVVADCVACAPGNPTHVLTSDVEAEHIPGCNMAFRKADLEKIGGFDPNFWIAGDDVDLCWRLQEAGGTLGFSPAAVVWHHRRGSIDGYWRQQRNYGRAEALLEEKWPEKYNRFGHLTWQSRLYGHGLNDSFFFRRARVFHGTWGNALFQPLYDGAPGTFFSLLAMPEWYLLISILLGITLLGFLWPPLFGALPLLILTAGASLTNALNEGARAEFPTPPPTRARLFGQRLLTAGLYLLQPLARLWGRLRFGLTPWRRLPYSAFVLPRPRQARLWSKKWRAADGWLTAVGAELRRQGGVVSRGGDFDRWDLEVRGGLLCNVRALMTIEEHGQGRQLLRFRLWPHMMYPAFVLLATLVVIAVMATLAAAWPAAVLFGVLATFTLLRMIAECGAAMGIFLAVLSKPPTEIQP